MKAAVGKVRVATIAAVAMTMLAVVGLHRFSGRAYSADPTPTLFVTDGCAQGVLAYPASGSGDIPPLAAGTGLGSPRFVAFDKNGNIYVSNNCSNDITIFAKGSNGDSAPIAKIAGAATGLSSPEGIAVDPKSGNIYVANEAASVTIYPALGSSTGNLNEAPIATISGGNTDLLKPIGIALDSGLNIYVADSEEFQVFVYP